MSRTIEVFIGDAEAFFHIARRQFVERASGMRQRSFQELYISEVLETANGDLLAILPQPDLKKQTIVRQDELGHILQWGKNEKDRVVFGVGGILFAAILASGVYMSKTKEDPTYIFASTFNEGIKGSAIAELSYMGTSGRLSQAQQEKVRRATEEDPSGLVFVKDVLFGGDLFFPDFYRYVSERTPHRSHVFKGASSFIPSYEKLYQRYQSEQHNPQFSEEVRNFWKEKAQAEFKV